MKPMTKKALLNGYEGMTREELIDELLELETMFSDLRDDLDDANDINDHLTAELEKYEEAEEMAIQEKLAKE